MAETQKATGATGNGGKATDSMAAARAARGKRQAVAETLDPRERYARKQMQQARAALVNCQKHLEEGGEIPASILDACAELQKAAASMLFG